MTTLISLALTPSHRLVLHAETTGHEATDEDLSKKLRSLLATPNYRGLLRLGGTQFTVALPPSVHFWQHFARLFITQLCHQVSSTDDATVTTLALPAENALEGLLNQAPFMQGGEYLNKEALRTIWQGLQEALHQELLAYGGNLQQYLNSFHANWNLLGRIYFHLAENKQNVDHPFAFLATYTNQLSHAGEVQHLSLDKALQEYANNKQTLLSLLIPLQKAAEVSGFIKQLVDSQKIFRPLLWSATDAYLFLQAVPYCESAGILVRIPNWWKAEQPPRPRVKVSLGKNNTSALGLEAVLDFDFEIALDNGELLTKEEWESVLASTDHLVKVKGQWIEVDRFKLQEVLSHWKKIQRRAKKEGLTLAEGLRLLASSGTAETAEAIGFPSTSTVADWSTVAAGDWLATTLAQLRSPHLQHQEHLLTILRKHLKATLRPYQWHGVQWLWLLYNLKLGSCLADDMGLGKTIQVIALFLLIKYQCSPQKPHLLIVPSSLLTNWQAELARFAPDLRLWMAHSSAQTADMLKHVTPKQLRTVDVVMTTYSFTYRLPWLSDYAWDCVILDEAQSIKNPAAKQSIIIKMIKSQVRFALTGTPIENRLSDLWSLFDFTSPGLLGSAKTFSRYQNAMTKQKNDDAQRFYSTLRQLVRPYILRRLKSDKSIIADLPDKVEVHSFCTLSKLQVALYQQALHEFTQHLQTLPVPEAIYRKGVILAYLLRFKQICNHPSQWLGYDNYATADSGKFLRLVELCETIAEKQEKILVFTQFTEIMPALRECLSQVFRQEGLMLHGQTPLKARQKMVGAFQTETGPPFFVLSLKAGGTGLTLTQASHVIHFDRWWNPAVENQATDRAYRIGQKKNVMVHKFVCQGTIEEKIDALITSKKALSHEILSAQTQEEINITTLSNEALLEMVALDIKRAFAENA